MDYHSTYIPWGESGSDCCDVSFVIRKVEVRKLADTRFVVWMYTVKLDYLINIFFSDHKTAGRLVCSRSSSTLLSVVCEVDQGEGATCGAAAQSTAARSKGTLQLLDPTSFTTSSSKYDCVQYCSLVHTFQ